MTLGPGQPTVAIVYEPGEARSRLESELKEAGLNVVTFDSVSSLVAAYAPSTIHCVVAGWDAATAEDYAMIRQLRGLHRNAAVVCLMRSLHVEGAVNAMRHGAVCVLEEPVRSAALVQWVWQGIANAGPLTRPPADAPPR